MSIFLKIVSGEAHAWIVYQDDVVTAFFDYFPASKWHLLIVPNECYKNIFEIPEDTLAHLAKVSKKIAHVYKDVLWIEHLNILQNNGEYAWQTVFHYHMHIIPRSQDDSIRLWWEHDENLRESYDELTQKLSENL